MRSPTNNMCQVQRREALSQLYRVDPHTIARYVRTPNRAADPQTCYICCRHDTLYTLAFGVEGPMRIFLCCFVFVCFIAIKHRVSRQSRVLYCVCRWVSTSTARLKAVNSRISQPFSIFGFTICVVEVDFILYYVYTKHKIYARCNTSQPNNI